MAYTGTTTVLWSAPFGSKRVNLVKVEITNYNVSGIPLGRHVGLGNVEAVFITTNGHLDDAEAPVAIGYDQTNNVAHLYKGANQEVSNGTNLHTAIGDIILMVIGS